jgi:hypothetical protein
VRKTWIVGFVLVAGLVAGCVDPATTSRATAAATPGVTQAAATQAVATQAAGASATTAASAGAPSTPVACTLITTAAAQAALGEPVADRTNPGIGENTCIFSGKPTYGIDFVQLTIIAADEFLPNQQSVPGSFTVTPTTGVGDQAYYKKMLLPNTGGESLIELDVKKGQTMFRVSVVHPMSPDAPILAAEKTLALAAVALM